jgi:hypothetical protein
MPPANDPPHRPDPQKRSLCGSRRRCRKRNAVEPHAYLAQTLQAIVNDHKQCQTDDLRLRNCAATV